MPRSHRAPCARRQPVQGGAISSHFARRFWALYFCGPESGTFFRAAYRPGKMNGAVNPGPFRDRIGFFRRRRRGIAIPNQKKAAHGSKSDRPTHNPRVARGLPSRGAVVRCLGLADPGLAPPPLRRFCLRVDVAEGDGCPWWHGSGPACGGNATGATSGRCAGDVIPAAAHPWRTTRGGGTTM